MTSQKNEVIKCFLEQVRVTLVTGVLAPVTARQ